MNVSSLSYREDYALAKDGLKLYFREYGDPAEVRTPLLCLSGLTRNSKDFHEIAQRLCQCRRVIAMDYRGRGRSGYDPEPSHYHPVYYANDALAVLDQLGISKVAVLGTSLGGLCAMMLTVLAPQRLAGVVLNDIGPQIDEAGRQRIATYVGRDVRFSSLEEAAAALASQFGSAYPGRGMEHWRRFAADTFIYDEAERNWKLDYDLNIALPIVEQAKVPAPDLWPFFAALKPIPTLAVRGALSDVLDSGTFARMLQEKPDLQQLVIPNCGHVPLPQEEPFASALERFLNQL